MSDLTAKFETLESQLATQHTDIVNGINAILAALGAPPPGDLITLDDIATQLNTINTNLLGIQTDNSAFYSSMLSVAGVISTNVETMLYNNSSNTQALISAIYTTSCACPTPSALLPLPIDVTPTELVDEAKCRRIQYYLALFGSWLTKIANYGSAAGFVTGDTLGALLGLAVAEAGLVATGAEVGAAAGPPGIVVGAVIGLISGAIFTLGGSILVDYANQFNDPILRSAMVEAMFAATNADEGYVAFKETLLASMSTIPAEIIYTLWWSAWSNDVYSGSPVVDDSAFDGTICAEPPEIGPGSCNVLDSALDTVSTGGTTTGTRHAIVWPAGYTAGTSQPNGYDHSLTVVLLGDYQNYRVRRVTGVGNIRIFAFTSAGALAFDNFINSDMVSYYTIPAVTGYLVIDHYGSDNDLDPFSVEFCPPV